MPSKITFSHPIYLLYLQCVAHAARKHINYKYLFAFRRLQSVCVFIWTARDEIPAARSGKQALGCTWHTFLKTEVQKSKQKSEKTEIRASITRQLKPVLFVYSGLI